MGSKKPWVPVSEVLDFSLPCPSIFASSEEIMEQYGIRAVRPLSENTMKRIARGLMKFVVNNPKPFIVSIGQTGFAGSTALTSLCVRLFQRQSIVCAPLY